MAKVVLRRNSKNADKKQQTMLMPQNMKKSAAGGLPRPNSVNNINNNTEGTNASGSARTEISFLPSGLPIGGGVGSTFTGLFGLLID